MATPGQMVFPDRISSISLIPLDGQILAVVADSLSMDGGFLSLDIFSKGTLVLDGSRDQGLKEETQWNRSSAQR